MKKIYIISLLFSVALVFNACQSSTINEAEYDAVFKSVKKIYTLNEDGSMNYQYQHELKYITHLSFNRLYGESFIVYNPNEQELTINRAETKTLDGRTVPSPENAFNKVLPRFAASVPAFNHLREMVVTHTGLELGCTVFFDYELKSKSGYLPFLNNNLVLQERMPIECLEITVQVPEGTTLNYILLNSEAVVKESTKKGFTNYTWKFKDVPASSTDSYQGHDGTNKQRLIFSSKDLKESLASVVGNADLSLSEEMKEFANERVSEKEKGIEIVRELQKIVGTELNTYRVPLEYAAYSVRPLPQVWKSNGGTELEKVLLLNEFIKSAGIESKVILAMGFEPESEITGNLKSFGHFYIMANIEDESMVFSLSSRQNNSLAYLLKNNALVDLQAESVVLPEYISESESGCAYTGEFKLSESGELSGVVSAKVSGYKNPYFNYLAKEENAKETVNSLFSRAKTSDIETISFDKNASEVSATIKVKDIWKNNGDYYFMSIPSSNYGIKGEHISTLLENRTTPLLLGQKVSEEYEFTFSVPQGFSLVVTQVKKEVSNEVGTISIEIASAESEIQVSKALKLNKQEVPVSEYPAFKELIGLWNKKSYNELILKKETEK